MKNSFKNILSVSFGCSLVAVFFCISKSVFVFPQLLAMIIVCNTGKGYEMIKCFSVAVFSSLFSIFLLYTGGLLEIPELILPALFNSFVSIIMAMAIGYYYRNRRESKQD